LSRIKQGRQKEKRTRAGEGGILESKEYRQQSIPFPNKNKKGGGREKGKKKGKEEKGLKNLLRGKCCVKFKLQR